MKIKWFSRPSRKQLEAQVKALEAEIVEYQGDLQFLLHHRGGHNTPLQPGDLERLEPSHGFKVLGGQLASHGRNYLAWYYPEVVVKTTEDTWHVQLQEIADTIKTHNEGITDGPPAILACPDGADCEGAAADRTFTLTTNPARLLRGPTMSHEPRKVLARINGTRLYMESRYKLTWGQPYRIETTEGYVVILGSDGFARVEHE
jgi:hypothetical protein